MTPRILFIASSLYKPGHPSSTGGTISNYLMLEALANYCDLYILLLGSNAAILDDFSRAKVIRDPSSRWRGVQLLSRWNPYVQKSTRAVVLEHGPFDAVIASSDTVPALVPRAIGNAASAVIIRAFENFGRRAPGVTDKTKISLLKQAIARRFIDARMICDATVVATNSHYMCDAIHDRFACDRSKLHVIVQQCKLEPELGKPPPDKTVGFVNRNADKNPRFVAEMAAQTPDIEYLVYGHEPQLDNKPSNLTIMGWSSDRQDMFSSAKVWIVPSLWPEPFGRVAIEAQAADRAAVVHAVGGLPETVLNTESAIGSLDCGLWERAIRKAMQLSADDLACNGARIRETYSTEAHDLSVQSMLTKLLIA